MSLPIPRSLVALLALSAPAFGQAAGELFADAPRAPLGAKPAATVVGENHVPGLLELKLVHGTDARLVDGRLASGDPEVAAVDALLDELGGVRQRLWLQSDESLVAWRRSGEARGGRPLHDLTQFFGVRLPDGASVAAACDALNQFDVVELAYPMGTGGDPVVSAPAAGGTPDFSNLQGYRLPAPEGIDAAYGNSFPGGTGAGTIIADCETGWTDDHEDLAAVAQGQYVGFPPNNYPWDHGTAVLGEMVGQDNGFGVQGICHGADVRMSTHQGLSSQFAAAIQAGVDAVGPGDAVVIEIQCSSSAPSPHPCEYVASTFAVVETATMNGIHVYAASGNGNNDLDSPAYGGLFDKNVRDSGAVMVGASNGGFLTPASFSNYGSRLDAHGWGLNVTSAGYGDLKSGPVTEEYTDTFSGTSSATPIVVGAGVILNSVHEAATGSPLAPLALRDILTTTGTPQTSGGQIGPRPDLRAAIDSILGPPVTIYCTGKLNSAGCVPQIAASGTPSLRGPDDFAVTCTQVLPLKPGLFFWSGQGPANLPFFNATLCATPPLVRTPVQQASNGSTCGGQYTFAFTQAYMAAQGFTPGSTANGQWWMRDVAAADGTGVALSDAVEATISG